MKNRAGTESPLFGKSYRYSFTKKTTQYSNSF